MRRRAALVAAVTAGALLAAASPADDVYDPLADGEVPSASEIADSVEPLEPEVVPIELGEPRSLREDRTDGERSTVVLSTDVLFAFDSAELSERAERIVTDLADELRGATGNVEVVGHTDSVGTDDYNQDLSERRAEAVADVLSTELGDGVEIVTGGRSFHEPVAEESEGDPAAAARNRRVEITFTP